MGFSHFITLTSADHGDDDVKIRVNVASILAYEKWTHTTTELYTNTKRFFVKESPELIDTYLRESYCTVKERHEQASYGSASASTESVNPNLGSSDSGHASEKPRGDSEVRDSSSGE
jgi:hypothetical protein